MARSVTGTSIAVAASIAWMALIFRLSEVPGSDVPGRFGAFGHFVLYAVLGALYVLAMPRSARPATAVLLAVALASLYGITDEYHQSFTPGRMPDVIDWVVDTVGAATGVGLVRAVERHRRRGEG